MLNIVSSHNSFLSTKIRKRIIQTCVRSLYFLWYDIKERMRNKTLNKRASSPCALHPTCKSSLIKEAIKNQFTLHLYNLGQDLSNILALNLWHKGEIDKLTTLRKAFLDKKFLSRHKSSLIMLLQFSYLNPKKSCIILGRGDYYFLWLRIL